MSVKNRLMDRFRSTKERERKGVSLGTRTNYSGSAGSDPNIFLLFRFNFCLENSKHINLKNSFS